MAPQRPGTRLFSAHRRHEHHWTSRLHRTGCTHEHLSECAGEGEERATESEMTASVLKKSLNSNRRRYMLNHLVWLTWNCLGAMYRHNCPPRWDRIYQPKYLESSIFNQWSKINKFVCGNKLFFNDAFKKVSHYYNWNNRQLQWVKAEQKVGKLNLHLQFCEETS